MPSPNKMFGVTASCSQSVEQIIRLQLQTAALKSKREINRSSYNTRGRHLQKKWQREGNSALKSRLNKQIYTPAVGGVGQHWGLLGSSPRVSQSLWTKRGVKGFSEYTFFFLTESIHFSETHFWNKNYYFWFKSSFSTFIHNIKGVCTFRLTSFSEV